MLALPLSLIISLFPLLASLELFPLIMKYHQEFINFCNKFYFLEKKMATTPVFMPGESCGQRSLEGCCPYGHTLRHDWSDLVAAAATSWVAQLRQRFLLLVRSWSYVCSLSILSNRFVCSLWICRKRYKAQMSKWWFHHQWWNQGNCTWSGISSF